MREYNRTDTLLFAGGLILEEVILSEEKGKEMVVVRREIFREAIINGNVSLVLRKVSGWAEYIREASLAMQQVAELAGATLQQQTSSESIPAQQSNPGANLALFVKLLKTPEFQQVMAMLLVQFLKDA